MDWIFESVSLQNTQSTPTQVIARIKSRIFTVNGKSTFWQSKRTISAVRVSSAAESRQRCQSCRSFPFRPSLGTRRVHRRQTRRQMRHRSSHRQRPWRRRNRRRRRRQNGRNQRRYLGPGRRDARPRKNWRHRKCPPKSSAARGSRLQRNRTENGRKDREYHGSGDESTSKEKLNHDNMGSHATQPMKLAPSSQNIERWDYLAATAEIPSFASRQSPRRLRAYDRDERSAAKCEDAAALRPAECACRAWLKTGMWNPGQMKLQSKVFSSNRAGNKNSKVKTSAAEEAMSHTIEEIANGAIRKGPQRRHRSGARQRLRRESKET